MLFLVVLFTLLSTAPGAQDAPLPDKTAFLQEVRKRLRDDRDVMGEYTYTQTTSKFRDEDGKAVREDIRVFEVYPSIDDDLTYTRLVRINGQPVPAAILAKEDAKHLKRVQDRERALKTEGKSEKERREGGEKDKQSREAAMLREVITMFDLRLVKREPLAGHSTILVEFQPKPGYKPGNDQARWLQKMKGRAWISESDYQTVRVQVETLQTVSFGMGVLARLSAGSHAAFERQTIEDDVWLPTSARFTGNGRIMLVKGFHVDVLNEYSDYRKLETRTLSSFTPSGAPR
jgi:hypothetical protein